MRSLLLALALPALAAADPLPAAYDLRAVDGRQLVSTRSENQIGPGPCWAFAGICAFESNLLRQGLWNGAANGLDLSEQWMRLNEAQGWRAIYVAATDTVVNGYARSPNGGGRWDMVADHLARLEGPATETQQPFWYTGTMYQNSGYYHADGTPRWRSRARSARHGAWRPPRSSPAARRSSGR